MTGDERLNRLSQRYFVAYAALMLFAYPLAVLPLNIVSLPFQIRIPSTFIATLISIFVLLSVRWRARGMVLVGVSVFVVAVAVSFIQFPEHPHAAVSALSYVVVPLAVAVLLNERTCFPTVSTVGFGFWLVQIVLGFWALAVGQEVVGTAGNRNWMACTLLALTPWAVAFVFRQLSALQLPRAAAGLSALLLVVGPTLYLLVQCASRAAWLALVAIVVYYPTGWLLPKLWRLLRSGRRVERILVVALALAAVLVALRFAVVGAGLLFSERGVNRLISVLESDIRPPLYESTMRMIRDHDWLAGRLLGGHREAGNTYGVSGVGPGRFTAEYAPYRSRSTYGKRLVSAPLTIHPHNEFLNIAAELGSLAAFAWLLLAVPILRVRVDEPWQMVAAVSAFAVFVPAIFDMPLVRLPSNLIAFFALGILWRPYVQRLPAFEDKSYACHVHRALASAVLMVFLLVIVRYTNQQVQIGWHNRKAELVEKGYGKLHSESRAQKAFAHYLAITTIDPKNVRALTLAGTVAIDRLRDPDLALPLLQRAEKLNPNFGHLNDKLGRAYGMTGQHQQALRYFVREAELFPSLPTAFQRLFSCLAVNSAYERLPPLAAYLDSLYLDKVRLARAPEQINQMADNWLAHIAADDVTKAISVANHFVHQSHAVFMDPMVLLFAPEEWPSDFLHDGFNDVDYVYWRNVVLNMELVSVLKQKRPDASEIEQLVRFFEEEMSVNNELPPFAFPMKVWRSRTGSQLSCYFAFAGLAEQMGFRVLIRRASSGECRYCILNDGQSVYQVDPIAGTWSKLEHSAELTFQQVFPWFEAEGKFPILAQALFLKNQILGTVLAHFRPDDTPRFNQMPTMQLLAATAPQQPSLTRFSQHIIMEPIKQLQDDLNQAAKKHRALP